MHVLTLVANSTLLNYIRRNYRTVLRAGIVGIECYYAPGHRTISPKNQRHDKEVGLENRGEGGGVEWGVFDVIGK